MSDANLHEKLLHIRTNEYDYVWGRELKEKIKLVWKIKDWILSLKMINF